MQPSQPLTFDRYALDLSNVQLWRGKRVLLLTSQTVTILRYLLDHAGQVVTKTELFAALWRGTAVSDGALTICIVETKALSANAKIPRVTMKRFLDPVAFHQGYGTGRPKGG